jgi:hypothetical protein
MQFDQLKRRFSCQFSNRETSGVATLGGFFVDAAVAHDVRFWHKADKSAAHAFVRYWIKSGHWSALAR